MRRGARVTMLSKKYSHFPDSFVLGMETIQVQSVTRTRTMSKCLVFDLVSVNGKSYRLFQDRVVGNMWSGYEITSEERGE